MNTSGNQQHSFSMAGWESRIEDQHSLGRCSTIKPINPIINDLEQARMWLQMLSKEKLQMLTDICRRKMDRYQALKGVFSKSLELNKDALFFKKSVKILSQSLADKVDKRIAEDLRKLHLRINRFETNKLILQLEIKEERKLLNRLQERKSMATAEIEGRLLQRAEDVIQREQVELQLAEFEGMYGLERRMIAQQLLLAKDLSDLKKLVLLYEVKLAKVQRNLKLNSICVQKENEEYLLSIQKFDKMMKLIDQKITCKKEDIKSLRNSVQVNSGVNNQEADANERARKFIDWIGKIIELRNCLRQLKCADREKEILISSYNRFRVELCEDISNKEANLVAEEAVEWTKAEDGFADYVANRVDQIDVWRASVMEVVENHKGLLPSRVGLDSIDSWVEEGLGLDSFVSYLKAGTPLNREVESLYEAIYATLTAYKDLTEKIAYFFEHKKTCELSGLRLKFNKSLVSVGAKLQSEIGYAIRVQSRMLEEKSREVANMLIPIELHFGKLLESKEHGGLKRLRPLVEMEWQLVEATKDSEVLIDSFLMPQVKRLLYDIQERRQALGLLLEKEEFEGFEEEHIVHSIERINRQREEFLRQESGELAQTMDKLNTEAQKGLLADYFKQVDTIEEFLEAEFQNVQIAIEENKRLEEQSAQLEERITCLGASLEQNGGWSEITADAGPELAYKSLVSDLKQLEDEMDRFRSQLSDTSLELEQQLRSLPMDTQRSGRVLAEKYQSLIHNAMTKLNIQDFADPHQLSSTRSSPFKDHESQSSQRQQKPEAVLSPFKQKTTPSYMQQLGLLNTKQIKVFDFQEVKQRKGTDQGCFILEGNVPENDAFYLRKLKALLNPQFCHFRVYSNAAHEVKFNPYLVSKFQPEKCGYVKGKTIFLPFMIAIEVELQTGTKLIFDALSLRKVLISQESSRIKKPIPKDFLFEIALFLEDKKRLDFLIDNHEDFSKFKNSVEAIVKLKPILKEFKESI